MEGGGSTLNAYKQNKARLKVVVVKNLDIQNFNCVQVEYKEAG